MPIRHKIDAGARRILETLVRNGYDAYIVGGAVRDLLLGIAPKDTDIATSATPEQVREVFGRRQARIIGRRFRIVHVTIDNVCYEVSTFRREPTEDERRGRETDDGVMLWRDNAFGSLEEDAKRRDFTVNSLYYDVHADPEQSVVDHVGGLADLRSGTVRATVCPRRQLEEDPVRILRALKLAAQYDFELSPDTHQAVLDFGERISLASRARLLEELFKILSKPYSRRMFEVFDQFDFLPHFWPNLSKAWDPEAPLGVPALLGERDRQMRERDYTHAKTLMIATLCLPHVTKALGATGTALWGHTGGLERRCRDEVVEFMKPFPVPRFLSARARDVLLLLPRFADSDQPSKRLLTHPEYKYARELFHLWGRCAGLDEKQLAVWPAPTESDHQAAQRKRRGRRRNGRRRKR